MNNWNLLKYKNQPFNKQVFKEIIQENFPDYKETSLYNEKSTQGTPNNKETDPE